MSCIFNTDYCYYISVYHQISTFLLYDSYYFQHPQPMCFWALQATPLNGIPSLLYFCFLFHLAL